MEKRYYQRTIDTYLLEWKDSYNHKPLLLRGARQVGKSSAIRHLGATFDNFLEINFEKEPRIAQLFEGDLRPQQIAANLSAYYGIPVEPGRTLLFFDEIQACPKAIHSLWFFYEDYPELHVIAAGSLLEFALKKMESIGVGRVRSLFMYPMSFDEFLNAEGNQSWIAAKQQSAPDLPLFDALHQNLVTAFRTYLMVGGMPESVATWVATHDYLQCAQVQDDILQAYQDDFVKYDEKVNAQLLRHTLHSVAQQAGSKFVYSRVGNGEYRSDKVRESLQLLIDAGLIKPVVHTSASGLPLAAETNDKFVKYLFIDSGLMLRLQNMESIGGDQLTQSILVGTAADLVNKGSITEMVAGLELLKYSTPVRQHELYYWQNLTRGAIAEVDYVIVRNMQIVPIEIKAGTSGSMKSLHQMMTTKHLSSAIRCSLENFTRIGTIEIFPLYALSNLFSQSDR